MVKMATTKPNKITLRSYQVGFGDCFLMTFHYKKFDRHILIDFGSTGIPKTSESKKKGADKLMTRVAKDIHKQCGGKLHAIVATHRHADHISGFATDGKGAPGTIIADCDPDVVVQPWTEHPRANPVTGKVSSPNGNKSLAFGMALRDMHAISGAVLQEVNLRGKALLGPKLHGELSFLGQDNIKNRSAVQNLMDMGRGKNKQGKKKKAVYAHFGSSSGLATVLPGVKVTVLGPPTLEQTKTIKKMAKTDEDEFWHFQAVAGQFVTKPQAQLFKNAQTFEPSRKPPSTRWFINRMQSIRGEQLLSIMRALDSVMNNTSLILLFEVNGKKLLFPGDAQIENWSYALQQEKVQKLLEDVDLYKVGHHGSLNATPKSLWKLFRKRSTKKSADRLQSIVSTMAGKHGTAPKTEVPRKPLVETLLKESNYFTTQELRGVNNIRKDFEIEL